MDEEQGDGNPTDHNQDRETEHHWRSLTKEERLAVKILLIKRRHSANVNVIATEQITTGQRVADGVARVMGSWRFIIIQSIVLVGWICLNVLGWINHWDPYPFILLNLALSFQAAYSAPIIMMSQNRQASKDRLSAELDYQVNLHAEQEVDWIRSRLDDLSGNQWRELVEFQREQISLLSRIEQLTSEVHRLTSQQPPDPSISG